MLVWLIGSSDPCGACHAAFGDDVGLNGILANDAIRRSAQIVNSIGPSSTTVESSYAHGWNFDV